MGVDCTFFSNFLVGSKQKLGEKNIIFTHYF